MKKKTATKSWVKNKRLWVVSALAIVVLAIITIPIWSTFLVSLLIGLHHEPSREEFLHFKQDEVIAKSNTSNQETDYKISRVKSILDERIYKVEAYSVGNRCYINSSGEFISSYSKTCSLRKMVLISSKTSSIDTVKDLQERLRGLNTKLYPDTATYPCFERSSSKLDEFKDGGYESLYLTFGPVDTGGCKNEIDQVDALYSDAEFSEHQNLEISRFNEGIVFDRMKLEGKKSYVAIAFDDMYFDEIMKGN